MTKQELFSLAFNGEIIPEIHRMGINAHHSTYSYELIIRTPGVGVDTIGSYKSYEAARDEALAMGFSIHQICSNF